MAVAAASSSSFASAAAAAVVSAAGAASSLPPSQVLSPAIPRAAGWSSADTVTEADHFRSIQQAATKVFQQRFKQAYSQLEPTMKAYTVNWNESQDIDENELARRIDYVVIFQAHRHQAKADLQAIEAAYTSAINACPRFNPDPATVKTFAQLGVNVKQIEANAKVILEDDVAQLTKQKEKITSLKTEIEQAYQNLKVALGNPAWRLKGTFLALSTTVSWLRDGRKQELGMIDSSKNPILSTSDCHKVIDKLRTGLNDDNLNKLGSVAPNPNDDSDNKEHA